MMQANGETGLGSVRVLTTNGRGATAEEMANRALDKIISVGENSHPLLREQALAYREQIREVLEYYMTEMVKAEHTNIRNRLYRVGHTDITKIALGE